MKYYKCNGNLYTANTPINNENFVEIPQSEYEAKLSEIQVNQEPISTEDEWFINSATESDYIKALGSLGVEFSG